MFFTTLAIATTLAQGAGQAPKAELTLDHPTAIAGSIVTGKVTLTFAPGLHAYQNPPSLDYQIPVSVKTTDESSKLFSVLYPEGESHMVGGEATPSATYSGTVTIPIIYRVPAKAGDAKVQISVRYQQCTDEACFPPSSISLTAPVKVTPAPATWNTIRQRTQEALILSKFFQNSK